MQMMEMPQQSDNRILLKKSNPEFLMNLHIADQQRPRTSASGLDETQKLTESEIRRAAASHTSSSSHDDARDVLQKLVEITHDSEAGFLHAAQHVHDRGLRDEFHKFARERRSMVTELLNVTQNRGIPVTELSGSTKAALHRAWMNIRTVLDDHDDQSILDEAERGEDAASAAYHTALNLSSELPITVQPIVRALAEKVERAHNRVRSLRDSGLYDQRH